MKLHPLHEFELRPREPFNFHLTASCYNFNWWFDGSKCVIPLSSSPPLVALAYCRDGRLTVEVYGSKSVDVTKCVEHTLGVYEDLVEFYEIVKHDPILREVPTLLRDMRMRATNLWNAFLIAVVSRMPTSSKGGGCCAESTSSWVPKLR